MSSGMPTLSEIAVRLGVPVDAVREACKAQRVLIQRNRVYLGDLALIKRGLREAGHDVP